jgi:hypothetical protein
VVLQEAVKANQSLLDLSPLDHARAAQVSVSDITLIRSDLLAENRGLNMLSIILARREAELRNLIKQQDDNDKRGNESKPDSDGAVDSFDVLPGESGFSTSI